MADGPVRLFRKSFDEKLSAAGLACSVFLGVGLDLVDWAEPGEAVLVALTGATLTFVVGAGLRAERRAELRGLVEAAPPVRAELERAIRLAGEVTERYPHQAPSEELRRRCRQFTADLEELSAGRIHASGDDGGRLVARTGKCRKRMRAVTNVAAFGPGWWQSPIGRSYWQANVAAIDRGVTITRIFITDDATDPEFTALRGMQTAAGVRTLVVDRASAGPDLLVNLVIWDERHAWQSEMDPFGNIKKQVFHHDSRTIARLRTIADSLESKAVG